MHLQVCTSAILFIFNLSTGGVVWHSNLVDDRGEHSFWSSGGGLRERDEGLQQEADRTAELTYHYAVG